MLREYIEKENKLNKKQKLFVIATIITISGIFGWLYEFFFYYLNSGFKTFYMRGGNFLPWINIYTYGAFLIILLTYQRRKHPLQVFLIGAIACGILELIGGILMDQFSDVRCWSYNEEILNFGNIGGFVCLRSVLFFGLSGLFLMYGILPFLIWLSNKMNDKLFMTISIIICVVFLIDEIYNLIITKMFNLPRASEIYKKHGLKYIYFKK